MTLPEDVIPSMPLTPIGKAKRRITMHGIPAMPLTPIMGQLKRRLTLTPTTHSSLGKRRLTLTPSNDERPTKRRATHIPSIKEFKHHVYPVTRRGVPSCTTGKGNNISLTNEPDSPEIQFLAAGDLGVETQGLAAALMYINIYKYV